MKKFAIIGMVFAGLMLSTASAWATPTGMTKAEYRALMIRSEAMNQRYGLYEYAQPGLLSQSNPTVAKPNVNQQLGEIGSWAVPSKQPTEKPVASTGEGFDWNNVGIGAALVFGVAVLGVASLLTARRQQRPIPH